MERSPNTVRAYAVSLRLWFEFLGQAGVGWDEAGVEDVARFVAWLRAPAGNVIVLEDGRGAREPATVNRHLAGVFGFYDHHARTGVRVAGELVSWRRVSRGSYKPFLHHVTKGRPIPVRPVKLHVPPRAPRTLDAGQVAAILAACEHLRDRFLLALLAETGMRVGQALGLRHADFVCRKREVHIVPRAGQRERGAGQAALGRGDAGLDAAGALVFGVHARRVRRHRLRLRVREPVRRPGRRRDDYPAVHQLVGRIAARTGIGFTAHMLRHTHATELIRRGVPIEVVARLLTHRSSTTTSQTYVHLDAADVREALTRAGVWHEEGHGERPAAARARQATARRRRRRRRPSSTASRPATTGTPAPRHPRPARARHGAVRRDQPALAARPGEALVPVPPGHRVRVRAPSPPGRWR